MYVVFLRGGVVDPAPQAETWFVKLRFSGGFHAFFKGNNSKTQGSLNFLAPGPPQNSLNLISG